MKIEVVPARTSHNSIDTSCRALRIFTRTLGVPIGSVIILAAFPGIAVHVIEAKRVGTFACHGSGSNFSALLGD